MSFRKDIIQDQVKETYNQIGDHFSKTRRRVWPETLKVLQKVKKGDKVLDLGCGNGRLLTGIKTPINYLGIDFSEKLLNNAKILHPERKFIYADITDSKVWKKLPIFDVIFCVAVLHHIPTRQKQLYVLEQSKKHLQKNGILFITLWNFWRIDLLKTHFSKESLKLKQLNWRYLSEPYNKEWQRFYVTFDRNYIKNLLKETGFNKFDIYYSNRYGNKTNCFRGTNLCAFVRN